MSALRHYILWWVAWRSPESGQGYQSPWMAEIETFLPPSGDVSNGRFWREPTMRLYPMAIESGSGSD